jgi:hypothetical protein
MVRGQSDMRGSCDFFHMTNFFYFLFLIYLVADNFCRVAWNQACPNFELNVIQFGSTSYSFTMFDVISFQNLTIPNGKIQGRVAVKK